VFANKKREGIDTSVCADSLYVAETPKALIKDQEPPLPTILFGIQLSCTVLLVNLSRNSCIQNIVIPDTPVSSQNNASVSRACHHQSY